jgi:hypothetical protein
VVFGVGVFTADRDADLRAEVLPDEPPEELAGVLPDELADVEPGALPAGALAVGAPFAAALLVEL